MRKDALMEMAMDGFSGQMLALFEERDAAIADLQTTYAALKTSVELILARMAADDLQDAQGTDNGQVMQDVLGLLAPRDEAIAALSKSVDLSKSVELIVSKLAIWDAQEQQEQKVNSGTIQPVIEMQETVKGLVNSFSMMNAQLDGVKFISKDNCRELFGEMITSAAGIVDEKIAQLVMPKDGIDGRDALDIQIEPRIDETKNVPRGTYAIHAGGLWRAHQKTSGMRGWECVVDGISDIALNEAGPRTIVLSLTRSSGEVVQKTFDFPVMLYKGVYEPGQDYAIGDVATFGGSLWHCNATTVDKPGTSEAWTLCVKRGRDGKDRVSI